MVRAITLRPPWAQAVVRWGKFTENRGTGFPSTYRGPVLIHVGSTWSKRGGLDPRMLKVARQALVPSACSWPPGPLAPKDLPERQAVLGVAEIVDAHPATEACCAPGGGCWPWGEIEYQAADGKLQGNVTHVVLEEVRATRHPVPTPGRLGLWTPAASLVTAVSDALMPECRSCDDGACGWCFGGWPGLPLGCGCHTWDETLLGEACPRCSGPLALVRISTPARLDPPFEIVACGSCSFEREP